MTGKRAISIVFGIALALGIGELFFSSWGNSLEEQARVLNKIPENESWLITGGVLSPPAMRSAYQGPVGNPRDFLNNDSALGYRLRPNLRGLPGRLRRGGETLYDVSYSTNQFGWRQLPPVQYARTQAAFFGDSYVFGHGLRAEDSLPARFAGDTHVQAVNYGVPGWGAQQTLRLLELGGEKRALDSTKIGQAFFVLIKEHLPRLAGLRLESRGAPRYELENTGQPKAAGNFSRDGGPFDGLCAWSAICEVTKDYFRINAMSNYSLPPETPRLLVAVLVRIGELLQERYSAKFTVVSWNLGDPAMDELEKELRARGVKVIPVREAIPSIANDLTSYVVPFDGHPTAKATAELASFLARQ